MSLIRAVLFDLDGTLLDTLEDIARSANLVLARAGFSPHPQGDYRQFIGDGVARLFQRALPSEAAENPGLIADCVEGFREVYGAGWNVATKPYPGITDLLDELVARSIRLAVLSNKPDEFTQRCVEHFFSRRPFESVRGECPDVPRKPDPAGAILTAGRLGLQPTEMAYLGDSSVDMRTAAAAGMIPLGAGWGFRLAEELETHGAVAILSHPLDLAEWLDAGLESSR